MLDMDRVIALFSLFSDLAEETLEPWLPFCRAGAASIEARLRENVDAGDEMEALCAAAAASAYCDYLLLGKVVGASESLKVGDISLSSASSAETMGALEIRAHFLGKVAHLLRADCPALIATPGDEL